MFTELTGEGVVEFGVVDESLPADGSTGLFEVNSHDDMEILLRTLCIITEFTSILEC
jgi:hypothetical protein